MSDDQVTPVPGMGATIYIGSDRYPATVIAVSESGKTVTVQQDTEPRYRPELPENTRQAPDGTWRIGGRRGKMVTFGKRDYYLDPSF